MTIDIALAADGEDAVLDWEFRNLEANETDADRDQERDFWREAGVVPLAAELDKFVQHEDRGGGLSVFSDAWWDLRAKNWCSCGVKTALDVVGFDKDSEAFDLQDCDDLPRTFHGTTFTNLISILEASGLKAGPNGHSCKGRHYKGIFQAASFGEAFHRAG